MYYYSFLSEKVLHTLSFGALHQFEPHMEVTNFLTCGDMNSKIPLTHANCTRL
jgi:hypothetical protein